jgi:GntR family transcriptional regulator, transcriptional repressor for pyruvate dehydrogenase complex
MSKPEISIQSHLFGQYAKRQGINSAIPPRHRKQVAAITKRGTINGDRRERMSRGESIVPILIDYIKVSRLAGGDKLQTEVELSAALGVSTRSLREALVTLKTLGVVEARHGRGWYITEFELAANVPIVIGPLLQHFNRAGIRQMLEARLCIEPFIASIVAKKTIHDGIEKLGVALEAMKTNAYVNPNDFRIADREFHDIMAEMCGNEFLLLQNSILSGVFFPVQIELPQEEFDRVVREHEEIYKKVVAGDADGAALAARIHIEEAMRLLQKYGFC